MVSFFIKDFVIEQMPLCPCPNQAFLVDVDANSATVSWMPRQNESSWLYSCCEHHTVPTNWTAVSDTFVNINSLVASKRYDFYLKSVCSSAEIGNPIFPVITFATSCPSGIEVPYYETFSNALMESCWIGTQFSTLSMGQIADVGISPYILPDTIPMSEMMVKITYTGSDFEFGIQSDPLDTSTFTFVEHVSSSDNYTEILLNTYSGTGRHLAFKTDGITYIDEIQVLPIPACIYPFPVSVDNISSTSAEVNFTNRGSENSWEIAVGPVGFDPDNGGVHQIISYTSYEINGLSPLTDYDVYVRSVCGNQHSDWSVKKTFITHCTSITQIPYEESFDSYGTDYGNAFPVCWFRYSTPDPQIVSYYDSGSDTIYPHSMPGFLRIYGSPIANQNIVCLPELDQTLDLQRLQISFRLSFSSYDNREVQVGVMTNPHDLSTFEIVQTVNDTFNVVSFYNYTGAGRNIALKVLGACVLVDDVVIDAAPDCGAPIDLEISSILGTSAILRWHPAMWGLSKTIKSDGVLMEASIGIVSWFLIRQLSCQDFSKTPSTK